MHSGFTGKMAELVAAQASKWPADIIVLGTHGRHGVGRLLFGSGAEAVLRGAPVPVLLVRDAPVAAAES
ncbi:universal stress protein [Variovorax humicola]|uniref:Universal stress protein n=1 Tax=Variovorax humicola TaxID=1769758 RepID=A0ABU8W0S5_9BURK